MASSVLPFCFVVFGFCFSFFGKFVLLVFKIDLQIYMQVGVGDPADSQLLLLLVKTNKINTKKKTEEPAINAQAGTETVKCNSDYLYSLLI